MDKKNNAELWTNSIAQKKKNIRKAQISAKSKLHHKYCTLQVCSGVLTVKIGTSSYIMHGTN